MLPRQRQSRLSSTRPKNSAIDQGLQFSELVTESILNGRTKVVQDADGQWDVQMDKGLTDWHSAQLKAINDSSDSKAVKALAYPDTEPDLFIGAVPDTLRSAQADTGHHRSAVRPGHIQGC